MQGPRERKNDPRDRNWERSSISGVCSIRSKWRASMQLMCIYIMIDWLYKRVAPRNGIDQKEKIEDYSDSGISICSTTYINLIMGSMIIHVQINALATTICDDLMIPCTSDICICQIMHSSSYLQLQLSIFGNFARGGKIIGILVKCMFEYQFFVLKSYPYLFITSTCNLFFSFTRNLLSVMTWHCNVTLSCQLKQ